MATKSELVAAIRDRYGGASTHDKTRILDEFTALTGYHRKHAIRVLNAPFRDGAGRAPGRRVYDEAVRLALVVVWEASDRICGKRLKAAIPALVEAMECHGHLALEPTVRARLLQVSAATIDRLLAPEKSKGKGRRRRRGTAVGRQVPVRTFADWDGATPGEVEADFVVHSGGSMSGSMVHSLVVTEVVSGWTECMPLLSREQGLVVAGFSVLKSRMPCGIHALNTDNDSAFINETVLAYCQGENIRFTRSRPYRKNDQAWIEQKNGAVVRRLVGYQRIEGLRAVQVLSRLYGAARLFVNYFQPSFKLKQKTRDGAKVSKRYHKPLTPYERVLANPAVSDDVKIGLTKVKRTLDPVHLLSAIRMAQRELLTMDEELAPIDSSETTDTFLEVVTDLWRKGEPSPKARKRSPLPRSWRTRVDPFEAHWPEIAGWLQSEPDLTARAALGRLLERNEDGLSVKQLRTLQRRVQAWRSAQARALIQLAG